MDRRAAGALLALAACIASSAAAPTTGGDHTALDLYAGGSDGCYYNFQHYGEGDRIMTNEPCLNCTCHNRMLMCYLRVCPFTKPIGQDCTVEKRADQCCPIITCPDVPVDLLTSTSTSSPAEYGATGLGKVDKYGCSMNGKYFPEGSKVPPTPNKPCEHCYCIRNMTTCVMQECTLHVDGCTPIYHKDVCCPIRYSCDHPEDEVPLLDDMSTTIRPTPGFLLTSTTLSPVTQMTQDCIHNDQIIADGASITTEKACEHCYCMKGDIVCVVQECGAPMENEGKNCTSLPPRKGQCCPDTYICEGDEVSTGLYNEATTDSDLQELTTLSPPRRGGVEGSGYRHEPNGAGYPELPTTEQQLEGSGDDQETSHPMEVLEIPGKPEEFADITKGIEETDQYLPVTTKTPAYEEPESSTNEIDKNTIVDSSENETIKPNLYPTDQDEVNMHQEQVPMAGPSTPASSNQITTEAIEYLTTVPKVSPEKENDNLPMSTETPPLDKTESTVPQKTEEGYVGTPHDQDVTLNPISDVTFELENLTPKPKTEESTSEKLDIPAQVSQTEQEEGVVVSTTSNSVTDEMGTLSPVITTNHETPKDKLTPEQYTPSTTSMPLQDIEKLTTEINHAQNTIIVAEEDSHFPHIITPAEMEKATTLASESILTDKPLNLSDAEENVSSEGSVKESQSTAEPDKGLFTWYSVNTIPSEIDGYLVSNLPSMDVTTPSSERKTTTDTAVDKTNIENTEKSLISSDSSTLAPESHTAKTDLYTITTEPSFRKEDELSITTDKSKEEIGYTTIKSEFVDEGLIPTSPHDDRVSTSANEPSTDEDITTTIPDYNKEPEEAVATKQSTTESPFEPSVTSEILSVKNTEPSDNTENTSSPSTEKSVDITTTLQPEIQDEPGRIPGEGDCLLNGVTYRNNTPVPNTNNCHTGCKCVSSIIKCDPIICSPPPDYMRNCQSIFDTPDSCCPTYVCDHSRETVPPQSDNQMSETEKPMVTPTIECQGDQCDLNGPIKSSEQSESCTSSSCLTTVPTETEIKECGPQGCVNTIKEPVSECTDGNCNTSEKECADGKCQLSPTDSSSPPKPCQGDDCKTTEEDIREPQLCANEQDCKKVEVSDTQTVNVKCENNNCDSSDISTPPSQPKPCTDENCKSEEVKPSDCTGSGPCRRKDSPVSEQIPSKCVDDDCTQNFDTSVPQDDSYQLSTAKPILEESPFSEVTDKNVPAEEEHGTEATNLGPNIDDISPTIQSSTEKAPVESDITGIEDVTDKVSEVDKNPTEEPILIEKEINESPTTPDIIESMITTDNTEEINKPELIPVQQPSTQIPDQDQQTLDKEPIGPSEEEVSGTPYVTEEHTEKVILGSELDKDHEQPKPTLSDIEPTKETNTGQENSEEPVSSTDKITISPVDEQTTEAPYNLDKITDGETTKLPNISEEYEGTVTDSLDTTKKHTDDGIKVDDLTTRIPDIVQEYTNSPLPTTAQDTKISDGQDIAEKIDIPEEEDITVALVTDEYPITTTGKPEIVKDYTTKVTSIGEIVTEAPGFTDEQNIPVIVTEESTATSDTEKPSYEIPVSVKKPSPDTPTTEKEADEKLIQGEIETTSPPVPDTQLYTNQPTEIPDVIEDKTEKLPEIQDAGTPVPDIKEDNTQVPVLIVKESTQTPDLSAEKDVKLPQEVDNENKEPLVPIEESPEISTATTESVEKGTGLIQSTTEFVITDKDNAENIAPTTGKPISVDVPTNVAVEDSKVDIPVVTDESSPDMNKETDETEKPIFNEDVPEQPTLVTADQTSSTTKPELADKPDLLEEHTVAPELTSKIPEPYLTESEKKTEAPATSINEGTEMINVEGDKLQTTEATFLSTKNTESSIKESDSSSGFGNEITTEGIAKLDKVTEGPMVVTISENLPPLREGEQIPSKSEDLDTIMTTESVDKVTKTIEQEVSSVENEDGYTGIPEQEPSVTKSPADVSIEPQEEESPSLSDLTQTSPAAEEVPKEEPVPESHVSNTMPEYEGTSALPDVDKVTETVDSVSQSQNTASPELHEEEPEKSSTQAPTTSPKDEDKIDQLEIYTPEKEEMITTTIDSSSTQAPVKSITNIEDSTNEQQVTPEHGEEITERIESAINIDQNPETLSSITTKGPEDSYTKSQEVFTDAPNRKETSTSEVYEEPNTTKSPQFIQETSGSSVPLPVEPDRRTDIDAHLLDKTTPDSSELPSTESPVTVTEAVEKPVSPIDNISISEEKPENTLDSSSQTPSVASSISPEINKEPTSELETEAPDSYKPGLPGIEPSQTTVPSDSDSQISEDQEKDTKQEIPNVIDAEKTTITPEESAKPIYPDVISPDTEGHKSSTELPSTLVEMHTELPLTKVTPEVSLSLVTEYELDHVTSEKYDHTEAVLKESHTETHEVPVVQDVVNTAHEVTTTEPVDVSKVADKTSPKVELTETTPDLIELEEHTHKIMYDISSTTSSIDEKESVHENAEVISTPTPFKEEVVPTQEITTLSPAEEDQTPKIEENPSLVSTFADEHTHKHKEDTFTASPVTTESGQQDSEKATDKTPEKEVETATTQSDISSSSSKEPSTIADILNYPTTLSISKDTTEKEPLREHATEATLATEDSGVAQNDITTLKPSHDFKETTPLLVPDTEKSPVTESNIKIPTLDEQDNTQVQDSTSNPTSSSPEEESSTLKPTSDKLLTPTSDDKYIAPEEKPATEGTSSTEEVPKLPADIEPTEEIPSPEDDGLPSSVSGYGDYPDEDQSFGPGTCRYGGKMYVSAQQIPRDDPCDFCFCFRSDIICLQQSCPPPIHGCHEEPIQGFCCPRYECPVSMATTLNVTTTTTTTTTTLPPHFPTHGYRGAAQRRGCQIKGHTYKVGEVVRASSGPCLHCTCGGDGQMKCDPKACTPEPMLRQMIAAAVSAKRRR